MMGLWTVDELRAELDRHPGTSFVRLRVDGKVSDLPQPGDPIQLEADLGAVDTMTTDSGHELILTAETTP